MPSVQPSIVLESYSYLESVKAQLEKVTVTKPKHNFSRNEVTALQELKNNSALNLKKADISQQQSSQIRQKDRGGQNCNATAE